MELSTAFKITFYVLNSCIIILGLIIMALGSMIEANIPSNLLPISRPDLRAETENKVIPLAGVVMALGAIVFLIGILGIVAVCMGMKILKFIYIGILLTIMLPLTITTIFLSANLSYIKEQLHSLLAQDMCSYYAVGKDTSYIDGVQSSLGCCGLDELPCNYTHDKPGYPKSCCPSNVELIDHAYCPKEEIYEKRCEKAAEDAAFWIVVVSLILNAYICLDVFTMAMTFKK